MPRKRSKDERRRLTCEIWLLRLRGASIRDIARTLNLPDSTVQWYLQEAERVNQQEVGTLTQEAIGRNFWLEGKERIRRLWAIHESKTSTQKPEVQIRCLEVIGNESERMIKVGQSLGIIHKEPDMINVQVVAEVISRAFLEAIPDQSLRSRLATIIRHRLSALHGISLPAAGPERVLSNVEPRTYP